MEINRENYEIYILDYYDGAISKEAKLQLFAFLDANPELKAEFDNFENINISDLSPTITFDFKESLKKENTSTFITESNCTEFFIADAEGDLLPTQKKQLDVFLSQNTHLFNDFQIFKKLKLTPDQNIVYQEKAKLKRYAIFGMHLNKKKVYQTISIAASFIILAGVSSLFLNNVIEKPVVDLKNITAGITNYKSENSVKLSNSDKTLINTNESLDNHIKIKNSRHLSQSHLAQNSKKETVSETIPQRDLSSITSIESKESNLLAINTKNNIIAEDRVYYTSLLDLISFAEEKPDIESFEISPEKFKQAILNPDLIKDQPIAEAGSFFKNVAIVGLSKIEALGNDLKDTYLAVEKRFEKNK
jgi:hypothetical protein